MGIFSFRKKEKTVPRALAEAREQAERALESARDDTKDAGRVLAFDLNLDADNRPAVGAVCADGKTLAVCVGGRVRKYAFSSLGEFRMVRGIGVVSVEAEVEGEPAELFRSDMRQCPVFETMTGQLEALRTGREAPEPNIPKCRKCGRPLPHGSASPFCPRCTDKKKMLRRICGFAKKEMKLLILSGLFMLSGVAVGLIAPRIQRIMVDEYLSPAVGVEPGTVGGLGVMVLLFALCGLMGAVFGCLQRVFTARSSANILVRIRGKIYEKVQALSLTGISNRSAGELITRLCGDTDQLQRFLTWMVPNLLRNSVTLIGISVMLFLEDWRLTLLVLAPIPLLVVMFYFVNHLTHRLHRREWQLESDANDMLHDVFSGIREVKVFGTEKKEQERFGRLAGRLAETGKRNALIWSTVVPFCNFLLGAGEFLVLFFMGSKVLNGQATLGELTEFLEHVVTLYEPIRWFSRLPRMFSRSMTSMAKVCEVLDDPSVMEDGSAPMEELRGEIEFKDACFGYRLPDYVLKHIDLQIRPGEFVGLVGRSGVGKTTAINLLMRMYDLNEGQLLIDGRDVREYSAADYRSKIGVVLQETYLFSGTIYGNLSYAKPGATREEVLRAAKLAGAHSFIMKLPDGYNTYVGARGDTLSGGEKQRIAIARAILRDPKLLILDEATSSLDTETEKQIQDAIASLSAGRTTVAIAHRLSTLRNATKLAVFEKGELEELGTHDELMAKQGRYYRLVMAQREMNRMAK